MEGENEQDLVTEDMKAQLIEQGWKTPDQIKSDYVTKSYHQKKFSDEVSRFNQRVEGKKSFEEAIADEEFKTRFLKELNVVPNGDLESRLEELKTKVRSEYEEKELKPIKTEYEALKSKLTSLTTTQLKAKLAQTGASLGLKDEFLTERGADALFKLIGSEYGHDDATGQFYKKGENGFETSTIAGQPYMTVEEHLKSLKKDASYGVLLFKAEGQAGPNVQASRKTAPVVKSDKTAHEKIAAGLAARKQK